MDDGALIWVASGGAGEVLSGFGLEEWIVAVVVGCSWLLASGLDEVADSEGKCSWGRVITDGGEGVVRADGSVRAEARLSWPWYLCGSLAGSFSARSVRTSWDGFIRGVWPAPWSGCVDF